MSTNKTLKRLGMLCIGVFLHTFSSAQAEWTLIQEKDGVKIFTKDSDCKPGPEFNQDRKLFKYENTNSYRISMIWDFRLYNSQGCYTCNDESGERHHVVELKANSSREGKCLNIKETEFGLFVKFNDNQYKGDAEAHKLTKFEFENLLIVNMEQ